ncbi:hypothetical protein [Streptomyces tritici]
MAETFAGLERTVDAHRVMEAGAHFGKLVVTP